ncbi:MAG: indolepyruvate ferredoxin oxidoreductase subunit alpha [Anaerolineae bacterium]|nr:indolepyruvate ferredoxin oxidoreductase subunit alpha [Anaerolineae bacterium]
MKVILSGNEAIARGAYEYGVKVATGYPGTPSSEILENVAEYKEIYSEWSVNEKVAMDVAIGAAYAGRRAMVTMKSVGMNVAADSFFYAVYTGVKGGLLIVTADDPGMFSSQNEQDNRHYARFAKMPMLEPADSQEAKDFVGIGLKMSEEWDTPVLLRTVMRVSHSASPVELGERKYDDTAATLPLERNPRKLVSTCLWARERHPVVEARLKKLAELASTFPFNRLEWGDRRPFDRLRASLGIVASGPVYHYAREVFPQASFLKLGMTYPLPTALIREFAAGVEQLLVIEELDPFLEEQIKAMGIACRGKDLFPACGELLPEVIERSAAQAGILPQEAMKAKRQVAPPDLPSRSPVLCPGCPHRSTFYLLGNKLKDVVVAGDIGCYNLGALPPFNATDTMGAMGASVGVAHGFDVAGIPDPFVAVIGDSTFFHAGIPPLLDIVHNGGKSTVVILDNHTTAMTGHQDHPGVPVRLGGQPAPKVDIEALVRASGVTDVHKVDAFDVKGVQRALEEALAFDGPSVVIVDGPCFFVGPGATGVYEVDSEMCNGCALCFRLGCPAIIQSEELDAKRARPKAKIDPVLCVGCDMCAQICPRQAIYLAE